MKITVEKVALFLVGSAVAGWVGSMWVETAPYHAEVIRFATSDRHVINRVGAVNSAKLVGITSVQSSISVDDKFTPGYDIYRVSVRGDRGSARVTVERKAPRESGNLRIQSIE
jgi:hypothetical protein